MRRLAITIIAIGAILGAAYAAQSLAGSEWGPDGSPERFIQFKDDGSVSGNAGCNGFFASYQVKNKSIKFGSVATTKKLCAPDIMDAERAFIGVLNATVSFDLREQKRVMILRDASEKTLLKLRQRDWD
jgi:heat shock protein HslJ